MTQFIYLKNYSRPLKGLGGGQNSNTGFILWLLYIQEVVTQFMIVTYNIQWVNSRLLGYIQYCCRCGLEYKSGTNPDPNRNPRYGTGSISWPGVGSGSFLMLNRYTAAESAYKLFPCVPGGGPAKI